MIFNKTDVESYYEYIKQNDAFPNSFITELFLIGKITQIEEIKSEITDILSEIGSKNLNKAFKSRTKIPATGKYTDRDKTVEALITLGKKAEDLDIGKMYLLLGYDRLYISKSKIIKKVNENPWIFTRLNHVKKLSIYRETFPSGIIPEEIGQLTALEELGITGGYDAIPSSIGNLSNLKKLELGLGNLKEVPETLKNLQNLEDIQISGGRSCLEKQLNETLLLPHWIGRLEKLESLDIGHLDLQQIPKEIFPPNLKSLNIFDMHQIKGLPEEIGTLKKLESFNVHSCDQLETLPKSMAQLNNLEIFLVGDLPKLKFIDGNIVFSPNIKGFRLIDGVEITEPEKVVTNIKKISIKSNIYLKYVVNNPELFPGLETLILEEIEDYNLEKGLNGLMNLKHLLVYRSSDISAVFQDLTSCPKLENIELYNSDFTNFPSVRGLKHFNLFKVHHCEQLNLNSDCLPENFNQLYILNADSLVLGKLPITLENIHLKEVALENSEAIGDVFIDVKQLHLSVAIDSFPASIANMKLLTNLSFDGSRETKISRPVLEALQELETLDLCCVGHIESFELPKLSKFKLRGYYGENLEEVFQSLTHLKELKLENINQYAILPIANLKALEYLYFFSCGFKDLSQVPKSIQHFEAHYCKNLGKEAVETICTWENLTKLHLVSIDNSVETLPESLKHLKLSVLELGNINIDKIPSFIGEMKDLGMLCFDSMYLDDLPSSIAYLPNLEYISINSTNFRNKLAPDFKNLKIKELRMFISKFSGNNMREELYETLITPGFTHFVKEFSFNKN